MLPIVEIQRFCPHDGPGIRTTIFLKGCYLNCIWCHNPETKTIKNEILFNKDKCINCMQCLSCVNNAHIFLNNAHIFDRSKCLSCDTCSISCPTTALKSSYEYMSIDTIIEEAKKDKAFYGKDGGITISGGEPMFHKEKTIELLKKAKDNNLNPAIETSGYFDEKYLFDLVKYTDYLLWDYKESDNERHKKYIGVDNTLSVANLKKADKLGAKSILRCIIINNVNFNIEHLNSIRKLYFELENCLGVEIIPYHPYGDNKRIQLGLKLSNNKDWELSQNEINWCQEVLKDILLKKL